MKRFQPQPGFVVQAFRYALDPNAAQEHALRSHCGAARTAYNWAVGWVTASWWQRKAEETYGVAESELTQWRPWSLPALRKAFNETKHTDPRFAGWWEENSKEAVRREALYLHPRFSREEFVGRFLGPMANLSPKG